MGKKLTKIQNQKGDIIEGHMHFWCPGCKMAHGIYTEPHQKPIWTFNNNFEKPTFKPSLLITWGGDIKKKCHSYITDGKIQFLGDCTHDLKGKTVEIPDWED